MIGLPCSATTLAAHRYGYWLSPAHNQISIALLFGCPSHQRSSPRTVPSTVLATLAIRHQLTCCSGCSQEDCSVFQVAAHHWIIRPCSSAACPSTTIPAALATRHRLGIDHCRCRAGYSPLPNYLQPLWLPTTTVIGRAWPQLPLLVGCPLFFGCLSQHNGTCRSGYLASADLASTTAIAVLAARHHGNGWARHKIACWLRPQQRLPPWPHIPAIGLPRQPPPLFWLFKWTVRLLKLLLLTI